MRHIPRKQPKSPEEPALNLRRGATGVGSWSGSDSPENKVMSPTASFACQIPTDQPERSPPPTTKGKHETPPSRSGGESEDESKKSRKRPASSTDEPADEVHFCHTHCL